MVSDRQDAHPRNLDSETGKMKAAAPTDSCTPEIYTNSVDERPDLSPADSTDRGSETDIAPRPAPFPHPPPTWKVVVVLQIVTTRKSVCLLLFIRNRLPNSTKKIASKAFQSPPRQPRTV